MMQTSASSSGKRPREEATELVASTFTNSELTSDSSADGLCSHCDGKHPTIAISVCGHKFHSRCVWQYPISACPKCNVQTDKVSLCYKPQSAQPALRNGKWTPEEEQYVQCIIKEFLAGSLPMGQGTPVRLVLARLLNCSPMRLSKKFQRRALGKHTYNIPKGRSLNVASEDHMERMRTMSKLETQFHEQVVILKRNDGKGEDDNEEINALVGAACDFWAQQFVKFAMKIGQSIEGFDLPPAKRCRRKLTKAPALPSVLTQSALQVLVDEAPMTPTASAGLKQPSASPTGTQAQASFNIGLSGLSSSGISAQKDLFSLPGDLEDYSSDLSLDEFLAPCAPQNLVDTLWVEAFDQDPVSGEETDSESAPGYGLHQGYVASGLLNDLDYFLFDPVEDPLVMLSRSRNDSVSIDF